MRVACKHSGSPGAQHESDAVCFKNLAFLGPLGGEYWKDGWLDWRNDGLILLSAFKFLRELEMAQLGGTHVTSGTGQRRIFSRSGRLGSKNRQGFLPCYTDSYTVLVETLGSS